MSSELVRQAAVYPGPRAEDGDVIVLAGQATARAATQLVDDATDTHEWWEIEADGVDVYITIGNASVAAPSITATSGTSRAIKIASGTSKQFLLCHGRSHIRDIEASAAGYVRCYKSSLNHPGPWARA